MCHLLLRACAVGMAWLCLLLSGLLPAGAQPSAAPVLLLDARQDRHDAWQVAQVLVDPQGDLSPADALARGAAFGALQTPPGNLGRRNGAVWLRVPVQVLAGSSGRWVLELDYAPLDRIDVFVVADGRIERQARLGDHVPMAERPEPARSHILSLDLPPGQPRLLLLRLESTGTLLAPLWLRTPNGYHQSESREQALQGVIAGMGLCLMFYSLTQWAMLRDPLFLLYTLTLAGTGAFFAALSGFGPQHLWGDVPWLVLNAPPFLILVGVCGAFFFVQRALEVPRFSPGISRVMTVSGTFAAATAVAFASGAIGYGTAQGIGMAFGPLPLLLVLPVAFRRWRGGDRSAGYVLLGWGLYSVGVLVIVGLLLGAFPVGFWTLHAFQFASMLEMVTWMLVLGERVQAIRRGAVAVLGEHARMRSLAQTDPLTGLLNRRGLDEALAPMLAGCSTRQVLAVYLLDLDGFKPVNDQHGHETGDALLVAVAQRLRAQLRSHDAVCRLGGDEFVVALAGLSGPEEAERIGLKILGAFQEPFWIHGLCCRVGMTVGYAVAPHDDLSVAGLLKRADAAMYAGKQAGKNCLQRGGATAGLSRA